VALALRSRMNGPGAAGPLHGISWIFIDIGWTLVDETVPTISRLTRVAQAAPKGSGLTVESLMTLFEVAAQEGAASQFGRMLELAGLPREWRIKFAYDRTGECLYPDAVPFLDSLAGRANLGVLANQGAGLPGRLERFGIADRFKVVLGSGDIGMAKPDPRFFARATAFASAAAEVAPGEILMVGDRPDNDIAPAKRLGWRTARIVRGPHRMMLSEEADFTSEDLAQLGAALFRQPETNS
jgi:HAD superfamily hydrolase (TIGR01549 family)